MLWWATTTTAAVAAAAAVFFAFVAIHICALVFGCVCRQTPALVLLIRYAPRVFRYSRAQPRPSGRWQPRVKGCRTAARVKFCRGRARACAHGGTTSVHLEDCPHKMNVVCPPVFRTHADLRRRRIDFCCVMRECCRKFPSRIRGVHTFIVMRKKRFSIYIAGIIPIRPGRRYTLSIYSTTTPICHLICHFRPITPTQGCTNQTTPRPTTPDARLALTSVIAGGTEDTRCHWQQR